jgi:hypothetical protein
VYCRTCGFHIGDAAHFCPNCGANQDVPDRQSRGIATPWIILALILVPPLGLILMFTSSRWSEDTRWIVAGFFFAPLWTRFLWRLHWSRPVKIAVLGVLAVAYLATVWAWTGFTAAIWITLLTLVAVVLIVRSRGAQPRTDEGETGSQGTLRAAVEAKLDSCHSLIAQIEQHTVFDFFPPASPARQQYLRALELRTDAMDLYEKARNPHELQTADARATEALNELKTAQDALWSDSSTGDTIPPP